VQQGERRLSRPVRAREEQADELFREIIEIADDASGDYVTTSDGKRIVDHENIQRSRLRVDARSGRKPDSRRRSTATT
jgi:terminase small subunit-like protein